MTRLVPAFPSYPRPRWAAGPHGEAVSRILHCQTARKIDPLSASNIDPSFTRIVTEGGRSPTGVTMRAAA